MQLSDLQGWWALMATVVTGVIGWITAYLNYSKNKQEQELEASKNQQKSADEMLEAMEGFKLKLVAKVVQEVEAAEEMAEKSRLLSLMATICPDCYSKAITEIQKASETRSSK